MYKQRVLIIFIAIGLSSTASAENADPARFYVPNLKCTLQQNEFLTEITFRKNDNRFGSKGFLGELCNYVVSPYRVKKIISSVVFKSIFSQNKTLISGVIGDEMSSTGNFTLLNLSNNVSGVWKYTATDVSGAVLRQDFKCTYSVPNPKKAQQMQGAL